MIWERRKSQKQEKDPAHQIRPLNLHHHPHLQPCTKPSGVLEPPVRSNMGRSWMRRALWLGVRRAWTWSFVVRTKTPTVPWPLTLKMLSERPVGLSSHRQKAGPYALPHFHQHLRNPDGHTFYETNNLKARKKR